MTNHRYFIKLASLISLLILLQGCAFMSTNGMGKTLGLGQRTTKGIRHKNVRIPFKKDIFISVDLYLPKEEGTYPTLIMQTAYSKSIFALYGKMYAERGYNVVMQDSPGRYQSDGEYIPFISDAESVIPLLKWL